MKRISVDIGGTFTDCFFAWDGDYIQAKALTTHHNLSQGFNEALDQACGNARASDRADVLSGVDSVRYATTLGTNALIERKGPAGRSDRHRGVRGDHPAVARPRLRRGPRRARRNDLSSGTRPDPLVPQRLIRSVRERVDYAGEVLLALDERRRPAAAARTGRRRRAGARGLPDQRGREPRARTAGAGDLPGGVPGPPAGRDPDAAVAPAVRPQGRVRAGTSTIVDAFLHPTMYHALSELEQNLRDHGYTQPMLVNHNSGGMAQLNSTDALQTIHSGPVAGIRPASISRAGRARQRDRDRHGRHQLRHRPRARPVGSSITTSCRSIDRWLVSVPMIHLVTLGAGGGSIAKYNRLHQSVQIGPRAPVRTRGRPATTAVACARR